MNCRRGTDEAVGYEGGETYGEGGAGEEGDVEDEKVEEECLRLGDEPHHEVSGYLRVFVSVELSLPQREEDKRERDSVCVCVYFNRRGVQRSRRRG